MDHTQTSLQTSHSTVPPGAVPPGPESLAPVLPAPASHNRSLGAHGENLAAEHYLRLGCQVIARNWRCGRQGELDLVVRDGKCIVAVEVKTRSGAGYGTPLESITLRKAERLRRLLYAWIREHREDHPGAWALRVDVIGIIMRPGEAPQLEQLRGIA